MFCEHCGVQNRETAIYCQACRKRMEEKHENQTQTCQQLLRDQDMIGLGPRAVFRCGLNMGMPQYPQPPVPPVQPPPLGQTRQSQPFPPAPRPQQLRYGPLLSRRTVLIGGAALAGGLPLVVGGREDHLFTLLATISAPTPFPHVALGTHLVTYHGHNDSVLTVAWSPDSTRIASGAGSYDPTVKVWNALDGTTIYTYLHYVSLSVRSLAWSPDGTRIVTDGSGDSADVHAWDATDGGQDTTFELPSTLSIYKVWQVAWSPDGKRIAAACESIDLTTNNTAAGTVLVWDVASAKALAHYTVQSTVYSVAWSPDSQRIAATIDNTVQVLEVGSWQTLFTYQGHSDIVWSVALSPDGTHIASASNDKTVQVWDATNGNTLSTYRGHTNVVRTVIWSPDSQRLASGDDDGTVQVWNAADASQIYIYKGHSDRVNQVDWSPDGTRIASASNDDTVQVWGAG